MSFYLAMGAALAVLVVAAVIVARGIARGMDEDLEGY